MSLTANSARIESFIKDIDKAVICDFGGAYGQAYFRLLRLLSKPVHWNVTEIPEIVQIAKRFDQLRPINFSESPPEADILYSHGVVMHADGALLNAISKANPKSLIIDGVECVDSQTFYTWQVLRKTGRRCVYVTYNRKEFVEIIESLGYSLASEWEGGRSGSGVFLSRELEVKCFGFAFVRS
jgi:putative methyltransferase (TIGR04325 family)